MALAVDTQRPIESPGTVIRVRGLVQGVGFRPHAWRLARDCGLAGEVWNDAEGVLVRIWGPAAARQRFLLRLRAEAPPLARIDALEILPLHEAPPPGFRILPSRAGAIRTGVVPDAATCPACLADLCDPDDRRHRYAFTNCTQCGPRLSIVDAKGNRVARLGGENGPGLEAGKFLAPHGIAMDSKGDIYIGEVGVTDWKTSFPDTPMPSEVRVSRCLQKLEKI